MKKKSLRDEKPWVLMRLDDNDNTFEMQRFTNEDDAIRERDKFTARGHKQHYYVERVTKVDKFSK